MRSIPMPSEVRNPFSLTQAAMETQDQLVKQTEQGKIVVEEQIVVSPADLGLKLQSTAVSRRRRVASINGRSYREEQTLVVANPASNEALSFRVVQVKPNEVLLESQGRQFELKLVKPSLKKNIWWQAAK